MEESHPGRRKKLPFLFAFFMLGVLLFFGGFYILRKQAQENFEKEFQNYIKEGYLTSLLQLEQICGTVSSRENSALLYREAVSKLKDPPEEPGQFFAAKRRRNERKIKTETPDLFFTKNGYTLIEPLQPYTPVSENLKNALQQFLEQNEEALKLIRQASILKKARYCSDLTKGLTVEIAPLYLLRKSSSLLQLEAILFAEKGDTEKATQSLFASLKIMCSLADEPFLIHYYIYNSFMFIFWDSLEQVLNRTSLSEAQLTLLLHTLQKMEQFELLQSTWEAETCFGLSLFELDDIKGRFFYTFSGQINRDRLIYLHQMKTALIAIKTPLPEYYLLLKNWNTRVGKEEEMLPFHNMIISVPETKRIIETDLVRAATLRNLILVLHIERYRLTHQKLPDHLEELTPQYVDASFLIDLCDGKPLRYQKKEKGYFLYSVGKDFQDNGGTTNLEHKTAYDLVFRLFK